MLGHERDMRGKAAEPAEPLYHQVSVVSGQVPAESPTVSLVRTKPAVLRYVLAVGVVNHPGWEYLPPSGSSGAELRRHEAGRVVRGTDVSTRRLHGFVVLGVPETFEPAAAGTVRHCQPSPVRLRHKCRGAVHLQRKQHGISYDLFPAAPEPLLEHETEHVVSQIAVAEVPTVLRRGMMA